MSKEEDELKIVNLYVSGLSFRKIVRKIPNINSGTVIAALKKHNIQPRSRIMPCEDLTGKVFNRLTVISKNTERTNRPHWNCKCSCGAESIVQSSDLKSDHTKSCGCLDREQSAARVHLAYQAANKYTPRIATAMGIWRSKYSDGDITFEDFLALSQMNCYHCGKTPLQLRNEAKTKKHSSQYAKDNGDFIYNGLDRLDNSVKNHTKANCVPCCKGCNWAKRDLTEDEFVEAARRVVKRREERDLEREIQKM